MVLTEALAAIIKPIIKDAVLEAFKASYRPASGGIPDNKTFLTVKQCAQISGLGVSTIRLYLRRRSIPAQKVGRRVLVRRADLEDFLEANPAKAR